MFTRRSILVFFPVALAMGACGHAHVAWLAQPVVAGGIQIQANDAYSDNRRLYVRAMVFNNGPVPIQVNRDAVVAMLPDGRPVARGSGMTSTHQIYTIMPGQSHAAFVDFPGEGFNWRDMPGAQVNWSNAITINGSPIQLPPTMLVPSR